MFSFRRYSNGSTSIKHRILSLPTLVSLVLAGAFLVFLITRFDVDLDATWSQVRNSSPWYLALAVVVHYTTFLFRGARWRLLLQNTQDTSSPVPGVVYCSQLVLLGWFANSVSWFRLGDLYRAYLYCDEQNASFSRVIGTILAERMLDTLMVVALLLVAIPFLVTSGQGASWTVLGIAGALLALLAVVLAAMAWARERVLRVLPGWIAQRYQLFHDGTLGSFRRMPLAVLWSLLGWFAEVGRLYLVVQALGLHLGLAVIVFLTLANSLLTLAPTPGGFGAVESGVAGLAVRLSRLSASAAAALVLVDRSISYVSIIIIGAALFLGRQAFRRRQPGLSATAVLRASSQEDD